MIKRKILKEQGQDLCLWEGAVKEEKFPHTRKPLHWWGQGEGSFGATEESATTGVQRAKRRDSHIEISANQHSPA